MVDPDTRLLAGDLAGSVLIASRGALRHGFVFSAYGHDLVQAVIRAQLGFNGVIRELLTGCYLLGNGHRAFSPTLMRFHSPDGLSPFAAGGINAYGYCGGDPVNHVDPDGRMTKRPTALAFDPALTNASATKELTLQISATSYDQMANLINSNPEFAPLVIKTTAENALSHALALPNKDRVHQDKVRLETPSLGILRIDQERFEDVVLQGSRAREAYKVYSAAPNESNKAKYLEEKSDYGKAREVLIDAYKFAIEDFRSIP
ncbi:RHS repeat-associated core domain-containing protein [Pseudomonas peradeniyensis]|uniref:RHS repeat-associated core domain-containing protein n=1 Tax=Pseudomonas TaxID=286 RepID=UPI002109B237|nr:MULTISPECIES: RHS repeat-associated core domain-containing protein [unclassified Pseudomonas]MCU7280448.1 RHS repeat-associated core domain-containing protein [Pseudomonas peradeniyensis]